MADWRAGRSDIWVVETDSVPLENLTRIHKNLIGLKIILLIYHGFPLNRVYRQPVLPEHNIKLTAGLKSLFHIPDEHRVHHLTIDLRGQNDNILVARLV